MRQNIKDLLLDRDNNNDNVWSVYTGETTPVQLLNDDGSNPYIRSIVAREKDNLLALDSTITITSELYRVTLVSDTTPSANVTYWLSFDEGVTKKKVKFLKRESKGGRSYWWVFLVLD